MSLGPGMNGAIAKAYERERLENAALRARHDRLRKAAEDLLAAMEREWEIGDMEPERQALNAALAEGK